MAAPVDSNRVTSSTTTAATSHTINVGSPTAGTLLIVAFFAAGNAGTVTFTGYTSVGAQGTTLFVFWRWADGTEGATAALTTQFSLKGCAICWQVTGATNETPAYQSTSGINLAANVSDPPSVAPNSPPQDTLYIVMGKGNGEVGAYTAAPTNYINLQAANSGTGGAASTNCIVGGASRQITASSSDDAGVFTHAVHNDSAWVAAAVAIRGAVVAAPGPIIMPQRRRRLARFTTFR